MGPFSRRAKTSFFEMKYFSLSLEWSPHGKNVDLHSSHPGRRRCFFFLFFFFENPWRKRPPPQRISPGFSFFLRPSSGFSFGVMVPDRRDGPFLPPRRAFPLPVENFFFACHLWLPWFFPVPHKGRVFRPLYRLRPSFLPIAFGKSSFFFPGVFLPIIPFPLEKPSVSPVSPFTLDVTPF